MLASPSMKLVCQCPVGPVPHNAGCCDTGSACRFDQHALWMSWQNFVRTRDVQATKRAALWQSNAPIHYSVC
jgi:hypothetical protein